LSQLDGWQRSWRRSKQQNHQLLFHSGSSHSSQASNGPLKKNPWQPLQEFLQTNEQYLAEAQQQLTVLRRQMESSHYQMKQALNNLQDGVRQTRMQPIATIFDAFPRMVRDLAREQGKEIKFLLEGQKTEMDRSVIQQIRPPLVHLLRNAIDHGLETPEERINAGKPSQGSITLTASQQGGNILIAIADDGRGIDAAKLRQTAIRRGLLSPEAAANLSDREALWLIFLSGFSTSNIITDISGRGVGMDVVRQVVEQMHGMIDLQTTVGIGTVLQITLPLTVATTPALFLEARGQLFAIPTTNVLRILRLHPEQIKRAEGKQVIVIDDHPLVVLPLAQFLGLEMPAISPPKESAYLSAIIVGSAELRLALLVDALAGSQEVVIKNLPWPFNRVRYVSGATIMGNGQVITILNVGEIIRHASRSQLNLSPISQAVHLSQPKTIRILVADDSITTRTLEKNILEAAGYQVDVAVDGDQAWTKLTSKPYDLLVSDVDMPNMNGFQLTSHVRQDYKLKHLPVILVTSLGSATDKQQGIEAGADAYIVKGAFDQNHLLLTVQQLV